MATNYTLAQVVSASDHCVAELVKAIRAGKQNEFKPGPVLETWAKGKGIDEDCKSFVDAARAMFEIEVVVRGLAESAGANQNQPGQAELSEEAARSRRMLFTPVYTLFEPLRRGGRLGADDEDKE